MGEGRERRGKMNDTDGVVIYDCPECGEKFRDDSILKRLDTVNSRWVCSVNCATDKSLRIYGSAKDKNGNIIHPWRLNWGIHGGTLMSRDVGDPVFADTRKALEMEIERLKKNFSEIGYFLWYASIIDPDGKHEEVFSTSYER
jgi:hypothetical protein